jgi:cytochrome c peroxidase
MARSGQRAASFPTLRAMTTAIGLAVGLMGVQPGVRAFPVNGDQSVLPAGTELNEDALDVPNEIFKSEAIGGRKSYLVSLGDMAFNSPYILGGVARQAGISCATCHVNGATNAKLYIPGLSTRPGNFDTTSALFNSKADDGVLDPFTVPSLRGARSLAPYGHDGRMQSLRDFVHNVIVNEFAGPEPSPALLDAIVIYIQDIDFLSNPRLGPDGRLTAKASVAERRGEALFVKPFPHDAKMSCANCHVPTGAFVDHLQHDVGSGGLFKTPTLVNADFNAPYFHDGRYDSYADVVAHFDRVFKLGLSAQDRNDLVAYLTAAGDGEKPFVPDGVDNQLPEITEFSSVLGTAIAAHDLPTITLDVDSVGHDIREWIEHYPERKDTSVSGGLKERNVARATLQEMLLSLRRVAILASGDDFDGAAAEYKHYLALQTASEEPLRAAQAYSLFNPDIHDAHYAAMRRIVETASKAVH